MQFIIVYQTDTDGDIKIIKFFTGAGLRRFISRKQFNSLDYAIINGEILKSFEDESFNLLTLKGE